MKMATMFPLLLLMLVLGTGARSKPLPSPEDLLADELVLVNTTKPERHLDTRSVEEEGSGNGDLMPIPYLASSVMARMEQAPAHESNVRESLEISNDEAGLMQDEGSGDEGPDWKNIENLEDIDGENKNQEQVTSTENAGEAVTEPTDSVGVEKESNSAEENTEASDIIALDSSASLESKIESMESEIAEVPINQDENIETLDHIKEEENVTHAHERNAKMIAISESDNKEEENVTEEPENVTSPILTNDEIDDLDPEVATEAAESLKENVNGENDQTQESRGEEEKSAAGSIDSGTGTEDPQERQTDNEEDPAVPTAQPSLEKVEEDSTEAHVTDSPIILPSDEVSVEEKESVETTTVVEEIPQLLSEKTVEENDPRMEEKSYESPIIPQDIQTPSSTETSTLWNEPILEEENDSTQTTGDDIIVTPTSAEVSTAKIEPLFGKVETQEISTTPAVVIQFPSSSEINPKETTSEIPTTEKASSSEVPIIIASSSEVSVSATPDSLDKVDAVTMGPATNEENVNDTVMLKASLLVPNADRTEEAEKSATIQESSMYKSLSMYVVAGILAIILIGLIIMFTVKYRGRQRRLRAENGSEKDTENALLANGKYKEDSDDNNIKNNEITPLVIKNSSQINKFEKSPNFSSQKNINTVVNEKNVEKDNVLKSNQAIIEDEDDTKKCIDDDVEDEKKKLGEEKETGAAEKVVVRTRVDVDSIPRKPIIVSRNGHTYHSVPGGDTET